MDSVAGEHSFLQGIAGLDHTTRRIVVAVDQVMRNTGMHGLLLENRLEDRSR